MKHDEQTLGQPAARRSEAPRSPLLFVPVRERDAWLSLRSFRTPSGGRTAVAFTSVPRLVAVLGKEAAHTTLCERALRELMTLRGIDRLTVDPTLSAPAVALHPALRDRWDISALDPVTPRLTG